MSTSLTLNDPTVHKNILVMSEITGKNNQFDFRKRLDSYRVRVILQDSVENNENFQNACIASLNLLPRFLHNVSYSGTPSILKTFPASHLSRINLGSDGCDPSITLVFGDKPMSVKNPLYVGSEGWSCYLSKEDSFPWEATNFNGLSSMFAGALAVGEIFKELLPEIPSKKINTLKYDLITHGTANQPVLQPQSPDMIHIDNLLLVGCGAVGQAFCWALHAISKLSGKIALVDDDTLEQSNEQRYFCAFEETRGMNKTVVLAKLLKHGNPALTVAQLPMKYEDYATILCNHEEVVSAVDNVWTRLNIQAGMPRTFWNGWTDVDTGTLRYGIGRHSILGEYECAGCAYYPDGDSPSQLDLDMRLTGFTKEEIEQKLRQNKVCTLSDIQFVATKSGVPVQRLLPNVGKPFRDLLHGDCGVFALRQPEHDVVAPAPHVPVLCGILLATQIILERLESPRTVTVNSSADFDAFGIPSKNCIINKRKKSECFCSELIYQNAYKEKWRSLDL